MITQKELLPLLRASSKTFDKIANEELGSTNFTFWTDEQGDLLFYMILGDYAHHIVDLYRAKNVSEFDTIFELIEQLHIKGDGYVKEAVTIGLLEDIQNIAGNSKLDSNEFVKYLQPESLKWWESLNAFWKGEVPYVGFNIAQSARLMFCKKCNHLLQPSKEAIQTPEDWEKKGARCSNCNYLYFPDFSPTWYPEEWLKDYDEKKEKFLSLDYSNLTDKLKEIYRILYFIDALKEYGIYMYFNSKVGHDHRLLLETLSQLKVKKTLKVAEHAQHIFNVNKLKWELAGPWDERFDDEIEDITDELRQNIDTDFEKLTYFTYLKTYKQ